MENPVPLEQPDHADVRIVPPILYVIFLMVSLLLQWLVPLPNIPAGFGYVGGVLLVLAGIALPTWSIGRFRRAGTSLIPVQPTTALVMEGPYQFTRNPMYL